MIRLWDSKELHVKIYNSDLQRVNLMPNIEILIRPV